MCANKTIQELAGSSLAEIRFVMDYLQLGFSGMILNIYSDLRVHSSGGMLRIPDTGARDALCAFIGHQLTAVEVVEDVRLILHFENGSIEIPLDLASRKFGDAAEFLPGNHEPSIVF